jgi:hypothetical protein
MADGAQALPGLREPESHDHRVSMAVITQRDDTIIEHRN